ncbi:hypothetical protein NQ314_017884 [Rhamnusium bicolor]|uniref:Partial AB-hydrolase lipase domain-containing protein n=1 Tax=Rhamnusium bicolor TaxID=1586634 RepID=A0AAV8WTR8_9CUCU|nr:hypothetical protein NQ314_017884 [Rhamnusium bicolor]
MTMDFVSSYGYPIELHANIPTEDGYLLDMFRIPHGKLNDDVLERPRPVIFLMHGLLGSAENWVISGPEKGLAFLLADRGYDVWMGNARGSIHSRKHVLLHPHSREFWQFR